MTEHPAQQIETRLGHYAFHDHVECNRRPDLRLGRTVHRQLLQRGRELLLEDAVIARQRGRLGLAPTDLLEEQTEQVDVSRLIGKEGSQEQLFLEALLGRYALYQRQQILRDSPLAAKKQRHHLPDAALLLRRSSRPRHPVGPKVDALHAPDLRGCLCPQPHGEGVARWQHDRHHWLALPTRGARPAATAGDFTRSGWL